MRPKQLVLGTVLALTTAGVLTACGLQSSAVPVLTAPAAPTTTTVTTPVTTVVAASPQTVYVPAPAPHTVYVQPPSYSAPASGQWYAQPSWIDAQPWITITPGPGQTPCQWLYAQGYSYPQAFAAWAQNGYPPSWSATNDGYPCQRTYGMQH
jgi:ABC-type Fe3+-hydroxamate transport system substrate-binding protein